MKNLLIVAGTRPEIIKLAPIILEAREHFHEGISFEFCLTGQHQTMAEEAMRIFRIQPDVRLDIMRPNQTLNDIAGAVFKRLPSVVDDVKPDVLMVQGDTTTAAMAALCAFNKKIPLAHVEAGLRSFDLNAPYPEECNRRVISTFARYNFCPTTAAMENLQKEHVPQDRLFVTGNTIVDAVRRISEQYDLDAAQSVSPSIRMPFVLITAHRRESFGEGFQNICEAVKECAQKFPTHQFVYPVHLNPNVQKPVRHLLGDLPNVLLISPVPYLELLILLKNCLFVLTDSGGIQEEAPSFNKYCIVMREVTERMESVQAGISQLVGSQKDKIIAAVEKRIAVMGISFPTDNPYGDGHASERILRALS